MLFYTLSFCVLLFSKSNAVLQLPNFATSPGFALATPINNYAIPAPPFQTSPPQAISNPLVDAFTNQINLYFSNNPERNSVFNLATLPATQAESVFNRLAYQTLNARGSSLASSIASASASAVASNFDNVTPQNFRTIVGHVYGNSLLKRGILRWDNVNSLANILANDIWTASQNVCEDEGFLQALINACDSFYGRLGIKYVDVAPELTDIWVKELSSVSKGLYG